MSRLWRGERAKLTFVYAGLLTAMGAVFLLAIYLLLRGSLPGAINTAILQEGRPISELPDSAVPSETLPPGTELPDVGQFSETKVISGVATEAALQQYLLIALIALVVLAAISVWVAWWLAGRVLRPVAQMAQSAREMSVTDLSSRIDLQAPPGELKELADTFDELLARIDTLVGAQQRFVANAAHELRTQLAVQRAAAEIGLADPSPERVARIRQKLIEHAAENEQLLEGLLLLAVSDQGLQRSESVELGAVAAAVAAELEPFAAERGVAVTLDTATTTVDGDAALLKHLLLNLVRNGISYNLESGGAVEILVADDGLRVRNTGERLDPEQIDGLFEPFRRLQARQHRPGEGAGLGLAIVASIARAHGAEASATANPGGGLEVRVRFPSPG